MAKETIAAVNLNSRFTLANEGLAENSLRAEVVDGAVIKTPEAQEGLLECT